MLNRSISVSVLAKRLLRLNSDKLAPVLAHVANEANISTATFKRTRTELPSSAAKWSKYAPQFGLTPYVPQLDHLDLDIFKTPSYHLPPSFHVAMFENAWLWQEVYSKRAYDRKDEASLRTLDPYIVPILALFQGRIRDLPEHTMPETKYSIAEVEHEIFMIYGAILIIKFDLCVPDGNTLARLFLDLLSTGEKNKPVDFAGLRIYGLLTDLNQFQFYSYDPATNRFYFDESIHAHSKRTQALSDMINISNKIFGVVLSAYMDGLCASIAKSKDRVAHNNPSELTGGGKNQSTDKLEVALMLAEHCRAKFEEPVASFQAIEEKGNEALGLLTKSVLSIPRADIFTAPEGDYDRVTKSTELKKLATLVTRETHERYLSKLKH